MRTIVTNEKRKIIEWNEVTWVALCRLQVKTWCLRSSLLLSSGLRDWISRCSLSRRSTKSFPLVSREIFHAAPWHALLCCSMGDVVTVMCSRTLKCSSLFVEPMYLVLQFEHLKRYTTLNAWHNCFGQMQFLIFHCRPWVVGLLRVCLRVLPLWAMMTGIFIFLNRDLSWLSILSLTNGALKKNFSLFVLLLFFLLFILLCSWLSLVKLYPLCWSRCLNFSTSIVALFWSSYLDMILLISLTMIQSLKPELNNTEDLKYYNVSTWSRQSATQVTSFHSFYYYFSFFICHYCPHYNCPINSFADI